jgi:hypothetical protein
VVLSWFGRDHMVDLYLQNQSFGQKIYMCI